MTRNRFEWGTGRGAGSHEMKSFNIMDKDSTKAEWNEVVREIPRMWEQRDYTGPADLEGSLMVIAATDDTELNIRIYQDAEGRAMLVNVVDVPPLCNFILPAIVRNGPIAIAISTAGSSPALAKRMAREMAVDFGEPYAKLALLLNEVRGWAKDTLPTYQDRKVFFESIVGGSPDPIELLRAGNSDAVRAQIAEAQERMVGTLLASA